MSAEERRKEITSWPQLLKATAVAWWEDDVQRLGASLAFYMIFAVAPLLVFALSLAGLLYGRDAAEGQLAHQLEAAMGKQAAGALQSLLATSHSSGQGPLATTLSVIALFVGASAAFTELRAGLNRIWNVRPDPSAPWWLFLKHRALAFALVLFVGVLFLALLFAGSAVLTAWNSWAADMPFSATIAAWLNYLVTAAVETILFAAIFRYLPDGSVDWKDVLLGAVRHVALDWVGQRAHRPLFQIQRRGLNLRSGGLADGPAAVDLLFRTSDVSRSRIHGKLCAFSRSIDRSRPLRRPRARHGPIGCNGQCKALSKSSRHRTGRRALQELNTIHNAINARLLSGSKRLQRCAGDSTSTTSSVGRTWASSKCPPRVVPSARPTTRWAWTLG